MLATSFTSRDGRPETVMQRQANRNLPMARLAMTPPDSAPNAFPPSQPATRPTRRITITLSIATQLPHLGPQKLWQGSFLNKIQRWKAVH